jgi:hypothetical protein
MMHSVYYTICSFLVLTRFLFGYADAQEWTLEFHTGTSLKAPSSLTIQQAGHQDTRIENVNYETRPWINFDSLAGLTENYYGFRLGFYPERAKLEGWGVGYEVEFLHDKAYYVSGDDSEGIVQHFELSDGLNYFFVNLAARYPLLVTPQFPEGQVHFILRGGMGPVVTAPTSIIRGLESGTRTHQGTEVFYSLAGLGLQASAQVRFFIVPQFALSGEVKATMADTTNGIANGTASTTIIGLHVNIGFTVQLP